MTASVEHISANNTTHIQNTPFGASVALNLPIFAGPMDLLLYLIKRAEIDIFDIPIAQITDEYLRSLEIMRSRDLDVGGEFLVMAATLLSIKARMLLPRRDDDAEIESEDPRQILIERILEYRAFKESAELLRQWEAANSERFWRGLPATPDEPPVREALSNIGLYDLLATFKLVMDRFQEGKPHYNISLFKETFDRRLAFLRQRLHEHKQISFTRLIQDLSTRLAVIITFLAILELARVGEIALRRIARGDFLMVARQLKL